MVGSDGEVYGVLVLVCYACRYTVAKIDLTTGKVNVLWISVVRQDIPFESEPVAVVFGVSSPALRQVSGLRNLVLMIRLGKQLLNGGATHGFLRQVCVKRYVPCRDVHIAL